MTETIKIKLESGCEILHDSRLNSVKNPVFSDKTLTKKSSRENHKDEIIKEIYRDKDSIAGITVVIHHKNGVSYPRYASSLQELALSHYLISYKLDDELND